MERLSLHLNLFNDKIKAMNQTNAKNLVLTASEARNLHNDIFLLLSQIAESNQNPVEQESTTSGLDGGAF